MIDIFSSLLKLVATFILSFYFGMVRQRSGKPIGFGAFIFVATGACALSITALNIGGSNPTGLLAAIVSGIGFLGAGALIRTTDKISGFTSAATIWVFAIFGLSMGVGEYIISGVLYLMIWLVVFYDIHLEKIGSGSYQKRLVVLSNKVISEKEIKEILASVVKKHKLLSFSVDKVTRRMRFAYHIEGTKEQLNKLPKQFFEKPWLIRCSVEPA